MFKKSISFLIAAGLICALIFSPAALAKETKKSRVKDGKKEGVRVELVDSKYGRTDVSLVKVRGLQNQVAQKYINATFQQEAANFARQFQEAHFTSFVKSKVMYNQNNILSAFLQENFYPERAAHSTTFAKAFTFDLATGDLYGFNQLFKEGSDYKGRVNEIARKNIAGRNDMIANFGGIDEQQEFYLKDTAIVIYYQLYRYTPFSSGFLEIEIPYGQVRDILADRFQVLAK
jgi:hypothetical protein